MEVAPSPPPVLGVGAAEQFLRQPQHRGSLWLARHAQDDHDRAQRIPGGDVERRNRIRHPSRSSGRPSRGRERRSWGLRGCARSLDRNHAAVSIRNFLCSGSSIATRVLGEVRAAGRFEQHLLVLPQRVDQELAGCAQEVRRVQLDGHDVGVARDGPERPEIRRLEVPVHRIVAPQQGSGGVEPLLVGVGAGVGEDLPGVVDAQCRRDRHVHTPPDPGRSRLNRRILVVTYAMVCNDRFGVIASSDSYRPAARSVSFGTSLAGRRPAAADQSKSGTTVPPSRLRYGPRAAAAGKHGLPFNNYR